MYSTEPEHHSKNRNSSPSSAQFWVHSAFWQRTMTGRVSASVQPHQRPWLE